MTNDHKPTVQRCLRQKFEQIKLKISNKNLRIIYFCVSIILKDLEYMLLSTSKIIILLSTNLQSYHMNCTVKFYSTCPHQLLGFHLRSAMMIKYQKLTRTGVHNCEGRAHRPLSSIAAKRIGAVLELQKFYSNVK